MVQYIDKDALVAEIEKRIKINKECMLGLRNLDYYQGKVDALNDTISFLDTLEVKEVDMGKSIDVDSMVTEYLKQYEEAGQTPFAMNIIGSAYRKGLEDMFRLKAQKGE